MTTKEFLNRRKVHLFFGGGLMVAFTISVLMNLSEKNTVQQAALAALQEIRTMEIIMYGMFWYWLARRDDSKSHSPVTTLKLSHRDT